MRSCMLFVTLLLVVCNVGAGEAPLLSPQFEVEGVGPRSAFYCQDPD